QRNRTYNLSGAIHQIDQRCVVHGVVAAFFELDAQGEYAGSGESAYARVEGREILLQVRRSVPLRIDRNEQDVELVGSGAERVEPGGQLGEGRGAEIRTRCVTEKDHAGFAGKSFVRHFYPVLIDQFKRTEDGHAFGLLLQTVVARRDAKRGGFFEGLVLWRMHHRLFSSHLRKGL